MAAGEGSQPLTELRWWPMLAALLLAHGTTLAALAAATPWTIDEPNYLAAGMALAREVRFEAFSTILHGPLPFLSNQLLFPDGVVATPEALAPTKFQARLGMLPLALLGMLGTGLLARALLGPSVAALALVLYATNPIVLGHGCLITADMPLTAAWVWVAWAALGYLRRPSLVRAAGTGALLGIALATKYLALFLIPALALTLLVAVVRGGLRPAALWSRHAGAGLARRLLDLVPTGLVCATAALLALHTCYLWQPGGYQLRPPQYAPHEVQPRDPEAGPLSGTLRALVDVPLAREGLALLPEPWVRGIDYQKYYSERGGRTVLGDRIGPGFASYFALALGTKLPLVLLLLLAAGLLVRAPPTWPRHGSLLLACLVLVPLLYLSFGTALQIGVRYLLPVVPLLVLVAGRALARLVDGRAGRAVAATAMVWALAGAAAQWPDYIGAFNPLAGDRPYLLFSDSNLDWRSSWEPFEDDAVLAARHPGSEPLAPLAGPRLGLVRARALDLGRPDPRDPDRVHHWLRRFTPLDREGTALLFAVDEATFAQAVGLGGDAVDPRGVVELAVARLGAGDVDGARDLVADSPDPDAAVVRRAANLLARPVPGQEAALGPLWLHLGRFDRVLEGGVPGALRAQALFATGALDAAVDELQRLQRQRPLQFEEALLLASCLAGEQPEAALAVVREHPPPEGSPMLGRYLDLLEALAEQTRDVRRVQREAGGGR